HALLALYGPDGDLRPLPLDVEGRPGIVATAPDGSLAVVRFDLAGDRIAVIRAVVQASKERVAGFMPMRDSLGSGAVSRRTGSAAGTRSSCSSGARRGPGSR